MSVRHLMVAVVSYQGARIKPEDTSEEALMKALRLHRRLDSWDGGGCEVVSSSFVALYLW